MFFFGGPPIDLGPMTTFTPTFAPNAGAFNGSSSTGAYKLHGKILMFRFQGSITLNDTGSGSVNFTLPNGLTARGLQTVNGRETQATGKVLSGTISNGASVLTLMNYDNTYPGVDNSRFNVGGFLEVN